jgi:SAM-dependent methyltransferase
MLEEQAMNRPDDANTITALLSLKSTVKRIVPSTVYHAILAWWRQPARVHWGSLRRLTPVSRVFGSDRGLPICWYYIQKFLCLYADDIRGYALEIGDDSYTRKFGGDRVTKSDVLHVRTGNPRATIVADLTCANQIPSGTFDCIIFTQTLQHIYDVRAAIQTIHRILRPGGVLLATFPGISQISRYDMDRWGDYWRFTTASAHKLFGEFWLSEYVIIKSFGNVLVAIAYLEGLASSELRADELEFRDPDYQVLIAVRAVKPLGGQGIVE